MAALQTVKRDYPMRELLADKSFIYDHDQEDITERQRLIEGSLLSRSKEYANIDMLIANTQTEIYCRRQNAILNLIKEAKEDFSSAIKNLDLSDEANIDVECSMLDLAIHISFMLLEITLYERIIKGQDERKTKEEAEVVLYHKNE